MRKNPTNLFTWATSELSQDAFICWLLAWAKPEHKVLDEKMHQAGKWFLNALLAKHDIKNYDIRSVIVITQKFHIDVLVIINDQYAIIIEDKVHTGSHGTQLDDYKDALKNDPEYSRYEVLPTFVKTGSQSHYKKEEDAGYKMFLREDFICVLSSARENLVQHNILIDFLENIEDLHARIHSFWTTEITYEDKKDKKDKWTKEAWIGFYEELQNRKPIVKWKYVANPSGGFFGAWWHFQDWGKCEYYLQIEQDVLCFKIAANGEVIPRQLRDECHKNILNSAKILGLNIVDRPGRFGSGATMTVAVIKKENWMIRTDKELIDMDATLRVLEQAERCIDLATLSK